MRKTLAVLIVLGSLALCISAAYGAGEDEWEIDLSGGSGYWSGNVTYQIGGPWRDSFGSGTDPFPISELRFPFNAYVFSVGGSFTYGQRLEAYASVSKNLNDPGSKVENSDWGQYGWPDNVKTTYSESETDLKLWTPEVGIRFWVKTWDKANSKPGLAIGIGYLSQSAEWNVKNLDQWYPQNPESGHDYERGAVGSYESDVSMPYVELTGALSAGRLHFVTHFSYALYLRVRDRDDHKLRYMLAETQADGTGWMLEGQFQNDLADAWFLRVRMRVLRFDADGMEKNYVYAGEDEGDNWEIYHEISSKQITGMMALGLRF